MKATILVNDAIVEVDGTPEEIRQLLQTVNGKPAEVATAETLPLSKQEKRTPRNRWTPDEDVVLRTLADRGTNFIAEALGRPRTGVKDRAQRLGISLGGGRGGPRAVKMKPQAEVVSEVEPQEELQRPTRQYNRYTDAQVQLLVINAHAKPEQLQEILGNPYHPVSSIEWKRWKLTGLEPRVAAGKRFVLNAVKQMIAAGKEVPIGYWVPEEVR